MAIDYTSLSEFYKEIYGEKVYKLSVDAGFTCPNRDGSKGTKGCIFCSEGGSGDFTPERTKSIPQQINVAKSLIQSKTKASKFIVYFQAFTNTYGPPDFLRQVYQSALIDDSIVGISIGTRPDCLTPDVLQVLQELNSKTDVYVELGLQSIHPNTAELIQRGYPLKTYDQAVNHLNAIGVQVVTHLILGLPGETKEDMIASLDYVVSGPIQGIKLHLLHVLKNTPLETLFKEKPFHIMTLDEYTDLIVDLISRVPKHIVIHRMTGDGPKSLLIAPLWSGNKRLVLNTLNKALRQRSPND